MTCRVTWFALSASVIIALTSAKVAYAQNIAPDANRTRVLWTVAGGGAGFGVGLWAGLSAFDDAVDSDRKVWTSAVVGAGIGAVAGYLIGRARTRSSHPQARAVVGRRPSTEPLQLMLPSGYTWTICRPVACDGPSWRPRSSALLP